MRINIKDQKRWSNHVQKIYKVLKDQNWHNRDELFEYTQSKALGARISELRKKGYIIKCVRSGTEGQTIYKLFGEVDYDTTVEKHCNCCKYKMGDYQILQQKYPKTYEKLIRRN